MKSEPLIRIQGLTKVYRPAGQESDLAVKALAGVDLEIHPGEYVAVMGPSGSGKSTLMQILGLLDRPTSGQYFLEGRDVSQLSDDELALIRAHKLGFVFQFFNLLPRTSSLDNVSLPLVYTGDPQPEVRATKLLQQMGLGDRLDHKPHQLSGGQQQRVAIARALANQPRLIFADEPTGNISSKQAHEILDVLARLNDQGVTIVLVTHEMDVAERAKRLLVLKDGLLAEDRPLRKNSTTRSSDTESAVSPGTVAEIGPAVDAIRSSSVEMAGQGSLWRRTQENLRMALVSLGLNKLRTTLATLGIIIGIASFVAMMAIGEGAKSAVADLMSSLGTNLINVRPVNPRGAKGLVGEQIRRLDMNDFLALKQYASSQPSLRLVDAQVYGDVLVSYEANNTPCEVLGATPSIETMQNFRPTVGRFFTEEENQGRARVLLIGQTVARELFGDRNPVGAKMKVNRVEFEVIGLLPPKGSTAYKDRDEMILVPLRTAMDRILGRKTIQVLSAEAASRETMEQAQDRLRTWLRERRQVREGQPDNFDILNMNDIQELYSQTTGIISSMLQAISFVSLLVGGTGIMNVMFVSVKERTREVGLRKAIGARRLDILSQFLVESVLICLLGGAFGTFLGWLLSLAAAKYLGWTTVFTIGAVLTSFFFSFLVGVVFGLWPARQAAELAPIEALRYE